MKILYLALILTTVTGCVSADPVTLRHPTSGQITKCPGYSTAPALAAVSETQQRNCVQDYQRQGYERVPQ
jgi:hypothetical protein